MPNPTRKKIGFLGAGHVGSQAALYCLQQNLGDGLLYDLDQERCQGKVLDMNQATALSSSYGQLCSLSQVEDMVGCDVVVLTAGQARRPGMSRDDLAKANAEVVTSLCEKLKHSSPNAVLIVVTNPVDLMVAVALKATGWPRERVIGMAGVLDAARFSYFISQELSVPSSSVKALVMGGHGDSMLPLAQHSSVDGVPLAELLSPSVIDDCIARTRHGGAEIVAYLKNGSAWVAPAAAVAEMVGAVLQDRQQLLAVSVCLRGEYGVMDVPVGVPCVLGAGGVQQVLSLKLSDHERAELESSISDLQKNLQVLQAEGLA